MSEFLERFKRFKEGTATQEEAALVHEEIERHEAIEEYLAQVLDEAEPDDITTDTNVSAGRRITRKIHLKIIGVVLAALLILSAAGATAVAIINQHYYNPNSGISPIYGGDGQLLIDMWAFSELHSPGYTTTWAEAWRDGPGSYEVRIAQNNLFTGAQEIASERIVRGTLLGANDPTPGSYWHFPIGNAFGYREGSVVRVDENGVHCRYPAPEDLKRQLDALQELPSSSRAAVYVTFKEDLSLADFAAMQQQWGGSVDFPYAAVESADGYIPNTIGFSSTGAGILLENTPEGYPYFQLIGHHEESEDNLPAIWEQHFHSMVSYLAGRSQFLDTMASVNGISTRYYNEVLDYINQNGVQIYGVLVSGSANDVLGFLDSTEYLDFYVNDVRLSILARG